MKRLLLTLLLTCLLLPAARAETALVPDYYAPVNPTLTRMIPGEGRYVPAMQSAFYLSANEIWYAYKPGLGERLAVLERYDQWGALRDSVTLDIPGEDQWVPCVTRVGDRLLVGVTEQLRGTVIVLDENLREVMRVTLGESVGIMSMRAAPGGILCSGFTWEGTQDCLYLALVNAEGHVVFESRLAVGENEVDMDAVAESLSCAGEKGCYVMLSKRTGGWIQTRERAVAGFDEAGQLRWQDPLPENVVVHDIAAGGGVVYVCGYMGPWDEAQAWAGAWSEDGVCLWQRIFETPDQFLDCVADESGCYLLGRNRVTPAHVAVLNQQGELLSMTKLQLPEDALIEGLAADRHVLQMMGYLGDERKLFHLEVK